jgi:serine protease AprX
MKSHIGYLIFISLLFTIHTGSLFAQNNCPRYWVSFTDKLNTPYSVDHPEAFLSERAIERRVKQNIPVTDEDLPVDPAYIDTLSGLGLQIINVSKWFNGALVATNDTELIEHIDEQPFIAGPALMVRPSIPVDMPPSMISMEKNAFAPVLVPYGYSTSQITMLHGEYMHNRGYRGEGMLIAILDAGFTNANRVSSLSHVWQENKIVATHDFVKDEYNLYNSHDHGTIVFSIIAGIKENFLYGSAPNAEFALVRTEEGAHEYLVEEYNWLCGAEFADSLGADIISSSLGYSEFDDLTQNHTYADLNGHTTPVSIAAGIAASKGIVVVTSAGNSGNDPWLHIIAPADADSILTIGAVDSLGIVTYFSSRGPSYDRRVKPDVCSQGLNTVGQFSDGSFIYCAGTSCSAPLISGMTACLWQANPGANHYDIVDAVRKAGDRYFMPDSLYGYGIPNLIKADYVLGHGMSDSSATLISFRLFPNPAHNNFYLVIGRPSQNDEQSVTITIFDTMGKMNRQITTKIAGSRFVLEIRSIDNLNTGLYMLQVFMSGRIYNMPFIKI